MSKSKRKHRRHGYAEIARDIRERRFRRVRIREQKAIKTKKFFRGEKV